MTRIRNSGSIEAKDRRWRSLAGGSHVGCAGLFAFAFGGVVGLFPPNELGFAGATSGDLGLFPNELGFVAGGRYCDGSALAVSPNMRVFLLSFKVP